uniref:AAA family ATPase n=1 Tax=Treponema sp. TaxID=166 RepID=UPI0038905E57
YGDTHDKVFILYGLRRTGKTTLIRQIIYNMNDEDRNKTVFIQINPTNTLADVNKDLRKLETLGYKYVFIDEVTMMDDYIQGAALFSDVFASSGMKIVLSGTDSLGFVFSEDEQLYDRCILLHTTFISFREFSNVLGIHDIDQYMEFGGTMSQSGDNYNKGIFRTKKSTADYVNTAIARNIQHSLKNYQYGSHFRNLKSVYDKVELTSAINRIVEDMNHEFTIEVLTRAFKSHDFGSAKDIMRKDRENPTDVIEIKEYLDLLDLTCDIPLVNMNDLSNKKVTTVFSQPGLRYSQAESLIKSLMMDETFKNIDAQERKRITERILDDIKGRMLEEIVQLETKKANPNLEVFKLQFAVGEFDMVVYDPDKICCKIYEIKHSKEKSPFQYRHLINEDNCKQTEFRYGKILEKVVLYRGESYSEENGVQYKNVEDYLMEI